MSGCNIISVLCLIPLFLSDILCWYTCWVHLLKDKRWCKKKKERTGNYWQQVLFQLPNSYLVEIHHLFQKIWLDDTQSSIKVILIQVLLVDERHENLCMHLKTTNRSSSFVVKIWCDGPGFRTIFPFLMSDYSKNRPENK